MIETSFYFSFGLLVNYPFFAAASPTFLDPNLMMQASRPPNGSPGLRMYQQQVPIPSIFLQNSILISILYIFYFS
jgi:hypothetical protein